ncbi:MAG TPA: SDR family oxidoreductase [Phnomibacter sp.]|nr:SDR family oxidoreductase [Phnomibacter sp.]
MNNPKRIVITGGSRGIGLAIAHAFAEAKQGDTLVLVARQPEALQAAALHLQSRYPRATVAHYAAHMGQPAEVEALGGYILEHFGGADILVNNAGFFVPGSVGTEAPGSLGAMLSTNLASAYHLTRLLLPGMMARQKGHIFNICSIASIQAYPNGGSYSISKFALLGMGKNLREELKPHGVKVTNILPGATYTDSWAASGLPPERFMTPQDVAAMVVCAANLSPAACVEEIIMRPQLGDI